MLHDERLIIEYLRTLGKAYASAGEICRRAVEDKRRWKAEPDWAKAVLVKLATQGILETNDCGQYRLVPEDKRKKKPKDRRNLALAPHIAKILSSSGRTFDLTAFEKDPALNQPNPPSESPPADVPKPKDEPDR